MKVSIFQRFNKRLQAIVTALAVAAFVSSLGGITSLSNNAYAAVPGTIVTPDDARAHGLESLRKAVINDGGPPLPNNLGKIVRNRKAAIQLGKALFWDMQVGSDGRTACASCHFHGGADNRNRNQMNPGLLRFTNKRDGDVKGFINAPAAPDTVFHTKRPNQRALRADYPFVKFIQSFIQNPDGTIDPAAGNSNDITSSMGVFFTLFKGTSKANPVDHGERLKDPVFNVDGRTARRVEMRNTPTVVNAVFNFTNFWDGRANNHFNGQNPFGRQDQNARVWVLQPDGTLKQERIDLKNASLASQAVGPPLSHFEMSFGNPDVGNARSFPEIGKKLLRGKTPIVPLGLQIVHPTDSVLGGLSRSPQRGLNTQYRKLVKTAFNPKYWNFRGRFELSQATIAPVLTAGQPVVENIDATPTDALVGEKSNVDGVVEDPNQPELSSPVTSTTPQRFTQAEANFALFFGISIMLYEATLIADRTPFDQWMDNGRFTGRFGDRELKGLNIFVGKGKCVNCHGGPELTNASVRNAQNGNNVIEPMRMARGLALYDNGFYNISVTPTTDDIGRGGMDLNGKPLAFSRQSLFDRLGIQGINFPIIGDDRIPAVDEEGNVVCTDNDANGFCDPGPSINPDFKRVAADGAFKTPGLRNVELTGPYFHNGGMATLKQVVEFYNRGGNFCRLNIHDLDPDIQPLGLGFGEMRHLTAFLVSLTDNRLRFNRAPFDHPQLLVPTRAFQNNLSQLLDIPAVGRKGSSVGDKPFLRLDQQVSIFRPSGNCSKD